MAIQDIITAITAHTDQEIAKAKQAHAQRLAQMRATAQQNLATRREQITEQVAEKKRQFTIKAECLVSAQRRNAVTTVRQRLLDETYDAALKHFAGLSDDAAEPLLQACLNSITIKGTLHPAAQHAKLLSRIASPEQFTVGAVIDARGGFRFISPTMEKDCTFETLVASVLRPATELEMTRMLFSV
ncbi:hypothetical protein A2881_05570 [Candidatus Peribacteria bacterium RIFCSPHIGHO2_01_FULL_55_13]|nr:MAG: hypothetical protein A2881_05570 [Candidatus Peribacteria bacterium RIFCSPHIGHO2_01_FULL_55_13]OGJ64747.1 MAG: hypothetical protein A3F36_05365 [Candidatus Peribacteria bacterium RIFCSPHIGHO2_12_FULL_55_11]